jgi:hypothetical protein
MFHALRVPLNKHDIVIHSFGLHYNDEAAYEATMTAFASDVVGMINNASLVGDLPVASESHVHQQHEQQHGGPHWFFIDALPQHFPTPNGYFSKFMPRAGCEATVNFTDKFINDWRNRIADKILGNNNIHHKLHYVPMAPPLYSQIDAHIINTIKPFTPSDCTHWCYPSNIYKYIHLVIFNMLRKRIKHFFPAHAHSGKSSPSHGEEEVSLMMPPRLKNGMLLNGIKGNSIFLIENNTLREFQSWNAFVSRGYDLSNVKSMLPFELEGVPFGKGLN